MITLLKLNIVNKLLLEKRLCSTLYYIENEREKLLSQGRIFVLATLFIFEYVNQIYTYMY